MEKKYLSKLFLFGTLRLSLAQVSSLLDTWGFTLPNIHLFYSILAPVLVDFELTKLLIF